MVKDIPNGNDADIIIETDVFIDDDTLETQELAIEYIKLDGFNRNGEPIIRIGAW